MRHLTAAGIGLIKTFEGCRLEAYECQASLRLPKERKFPTIGYGHTGRDVAFGQRITQTEAEAMLLGDLRRFVEGVDRALGPELSLTDHQFSALVSLAFNIGLPAFVGSTLLRYLRAKPPDLMGASNEFLVWKNCAGAVSPQLLHRRRVERELFLSGMTPPPIS